MITTLGDRQTDYFGLGKLSVVGEERFRSLTELKWGRVRNDGLWGTGIKRKETPV